MENFSENEAQRPGSEIHLHQLHIQTSITISLLRLGLLRLFAATPHGVLAVSLITKGIQRM